jgi:flavoprotein
MTERANRKPRIVVGISGASGAMIGVRLLAALRRIGTHETHLIVSASGAITAAQELGLTRSDLDGLADITHNVRDIGATIASGSFVTEGMVIAPCSMKTLAGVANGFADNLLTRTAQPRALAQHDAGNRNGRHRDAARARFLRASEDNRRRGRSHGRPHSGSVRHRAS